MNISSCPACEQGFLAHKEISLPLHDEVHSGVVCLSTVPHIWTIKGQLLSHYTSFLEEIGREIPIAIVRHQSDYRTVIYFLFEDREGMYGRKFLEWSQTLQND